MARIAYLGPEGTFTEAALLKMTAAGVLPGGGEIRPEPAETNQSALEAVRTGAVDFACVPIENSIEGSVLATLDSLAAGSPLQIYAELTLDVSFSIVTHPGVRVDQVRSVAAFPVAAAQVRQWLAANLPGAELVAANSNAAAALDVVAGRADAGRTQCHSHGPGGVVPLAVAIVLILVLSSP